jgi:hypothetical protein
MNHDAKDEIVDYLVNNRSHIQDILKDIIEQRVLLYSHIPPLLQNDIEDQFKYGATLIILEDLAKNLKCTTEDAMVVLSRINLEHYLRAEVTDI